MSDTCDSVCDGEILNSPVPPAKNVINLLQLSWWRRELEPVNDVVVEDLVVEVVILESPKIAAGQGKAKLSKVWLL